MADVIALAKSGRSSCRGCGRSILRGELRFGEATPNPYAEGDALVWFHLACAACMRPERFGPVLAAEDQPVADLDWLRRTAATGLEFRRLPRLRSAERAPSGSAHCRQCRELIAKGSWRIALQVFEEGRMQPIGTIHAQCVEAYFGTADVMDRIARLSENLGPAEIEEIERCVQPTSS